jgi:hypothetical protein
MTQMGVMNRDCGLMMLCKVAGVAEVKSVLVEISVYKVRTQVLLALRVMQ